MNKRIIRISLYFIIAAGLSLIFRIYPPAWFENLNLPFGLTPFKGWLQGLGPLLGALIVTKFFALKRETTFWGSMRSVGLIAPIAPLIMLTIIGIDIENGFNPHYYGFIMGVMILVYSIMEESGWRGYLQDELKSFKPWLRYVIIGTLWYVWHFTFLAGEFNLLNELIVLGILILSSWGIGKIAELTHSVAIAGYFHALGNILFLNTIFSDNLSMGQRSLIIGICLVVWIPLINRSLKKQTSSPD